MADLVHECSHRVTGSDGTRFQVRAMAEPKGHIWIGWLEFSPEGNGSTLRTSEETSQPTKDDVEYWASGLEPVYLEGALRRAR